MSLVEKRIVKLRKMLLLHRFAYYVKDEPMVSDKFFDRLERELKTLVQKNPGKAKRAWYSEICPTKTVGSSMAADYPLEIQELAERMMVEHDRRQG